MAALVDDGLCLQSHCSHGSVTTKSLNWKFSEPLRKFCCIDSVLEVLLCGFVLVRSFFLLFFWAVMSINLSPVGTVFIVVLLILKPGIEAFIFHFNKKLMEHFG